jgi:hypothetical protein
MCLYTHHLREACIRTHAYIQTYMFIPRTLCVMISHAHAHAYKHKITNPESFSLTMQTHTHIHTNIHFIYPGSFALQLCGLLRRQPGGQRQARSARGAIRKQPQDGVRRSAIQEEVNWTLIYIYIYIYIYILWGYVYKYLCVYILRRGRKDVVGGCKRPGSVVGGAHHGM